MTEQMTPLRRRMIDDMTVRNMSPLTQKAYVRAVKNFSKFFRQSPDELNFEDVREYQLHLVSRGLDATDNQPDNVRPEILLQNDTGQEGRG